MFRLAQVIFILLFFASSIYAGWLTYNTSVWGTAEWMTIGFLALELSSFLDHLADNEDAKKSKSEAASEE